MKKEVFDIDSIIRRAGNLPASAIATRVNEALKSYGQAVVTAPPGAGKSTLLPLTIMSGLSDCGKILMLEPRRIAARQIAMRMAAIMGEHVGKTVGYRVRFESCVSADTRIEVLTEGVLTRMLIDDATLDGVGVLVFDEFHERSINTDLAFALALRARQIIRQDLKIVVMSATIDAQGICGFLKAPLIESRGKMFPVTTIYAAETPQPCDMAYAVAMAVSRAHGKHEGDILAFLPGQNEILRCREMLGESLSPTSILPLYGNLSPRQQQDAIAASQEGERKVVLATPIAETSLTIEGVRVVIDSGLHRAPVFDAHTALTRLETKRISMDMAAQRAGRAGRVAEGVCYRLWTKATEQSMEPQRTPEIAEADLSPLLLSVAAFGENDIESIPWLTTPPAGKVANARQLLQTLGAVDTDGGITKLGKRMAALPCHPRIAKMIISAKTPFLRSIACDIAALLEEKDPMTDGADTDVSLRISCLRRGRRNRQLGAWNRIALIAKEYARMAHAEEDNTDVAPQDVGKLIAYAYPERIAKAVDKAGGYRLASGSTVTLSLSDSLSAHDWIAVASLYAAPNSNGHVFLAAPLSPQDIDAAAILPRDNISWDSKQGCVVMQRERKVGKLLLDSKPIHDANPADIIDIVCEAAKKDGLAMFAWDDDVQRLQRRVAQVSAWHPELGIPDLSTTHLLDTAAEWLPLYLQEGGRIRQTVAELKKIRLAEVLWNIIPYEMQQEIDRLAPTHIKVPTGSNIRIDYRAGAQAPVVSVRLQECFGMKQTPYVDGGKCPVLMELLSPGFKPVQLTQDLESFWKDAYFDVRKDLRRRYPKHYWPDNPLESEAVRGVRRK